MDSPGIFPLTELIGNSLMAIGRLKERKTTLNTVARPMTVVLDLFGMRGPKSVVYLYSVRPHD
jgi:hypothetical protein